MELSDLQSSLYECEVMHHRLEPKEHRFSYRIFLCAIDFDELDALDRRLSLFSRNRWNLYAFRDQDHLKLPGREAETVREKLRLYLAGEGIALPEKGRVLLVTFPRIFGYVFNPVSFYYCFDAAGVPLCALTEVGNTFGEQKPYLLAEPPREGRFRRVVPKHFYVSPFSPLDLQFDFRLAVPDAKLAVHINDLKEGRPILLTTLKGTRVPLTDGRLAWFLLKYPLLTLRVIFLIHWHALLLWLKRLPWFRKADDPDLQRDVLNPHASLSGKIS